MYRRSPGEILYQIYPPLEERDFDRYRDYRRTDDEFSRAHLREEDWRRSDFSRRPEPARDRYSESWKSDESLSWRRLTGENWRRERAHSPPHSQRRYESTWRRSPVPHNGPKIITPAERPIWHPARRERDEDNSRTIARKTHTITERRSPPSFEKRESSADRRNERRNTEAITEGAVKEDKKKNEYSRMEMSDSARIRNDGKEPTGAKLSASPEMKSSTRDTADTTAASASQKETSSRTQALQAEKDSQSPQEPRAVEDSQTARGEKRTSASTEGTLVLKAKFEDVHMFGRAKAPASARMSAAKPAGRSWYDQYKMNVEKRKQELRTGDGKEQEFSLPEPIPRTISPGAAYDVHRGDHSRYPRLSTASPESCASIGGGRRSAPRDYFRHLEEKSLEVRELELEKERSRKPVQSPITIDPNQFVEELSDSDDWDQADFLSDKRGLLGPPPVHVPAPTKRPCLLPEFPTRSLAPAVNHAVKTPYSSRYSGEDKSFFRMEYPSVAPKIYLPKPVRREPESDTTEPVQSRIAPAIPIKEGKPQCVAKFLRD
ncbi:hypothetical protein Q1695_012283 [Nippostrongylus brasiliensis]|nr:hypothetical protein Q1695_012283 [Nippostrongylus brasiliensis]